jgi:hypothetical protein
MPAAMGVTCDTGSERLDFAAELGAETAFYRGGERLAESFSGRVASCQPSGETVTAFAIGEQLPADYFAEGRRIVTEHEDGLSTSADVFGSLSLPTQSFFHTGFGSSGCDAATAADGVLRCLPPAERFIDGFFADADCTEPVEYTQASVLAKLDESTCPGRVHVYERGEEHPGAVYAQVEGSCELAHPSPPSHDARTPYHVFPSEIPAASFVELFRVTQ